MKMILFLILITSTVFAAPAPEKIQKDGIVFGRGANGVPKIFETNVGDGVSNPKITVDDILKIFDFNKAVSVTGDISATGDGSFGGNNFDVGDGTEVDQFMNFNISGAEKVGFKYDAATGEVLQKKKAGDAYKKLASGTGGAGGENYNQAFGEDDNANAEDGVLAWTETGSSSFNFTATDPLEGDQSFTWTPSAQGDDVCSNLLDFEKDKFMNVTCEASIYYIGGDENIDVLAIDGNGDILNPLYGTANVGTGDNNRSLFGASTAGTRSVSFNCPSQSVITGDALKGDIKLCLRNTGAGVAPLIKWDKNYNGTLAAMTKRDLPDTLSANFTGAGSCVLTSQSAEWIESCTRIGTGSYDVIFKTGLFSEIPTCNASVTVANGTVRFSVWTAAAVRVVTEIADTSVANDTGAFFLSCNKQGDDAKQSVQVITSLPKVSENENHPTANCDGAGVCTENVDFLNGSAVLSDTSLYTFTFNAGLFLVPPSCTATVVNGTTGYQASIGAGTTTTTVTVRTSNGATKAPAFFTLHCSKQVGDYTTPTKQTHYVGGVKNSYAELGKNIRVETCRIDNPGTPVTDSVFCDAWIDSITDSGVGNMGLVVPSGLFSTAPHCVCGSHATTAYSCNTGTTTTTSILLRTHNASNTLTDIDLTITCIGER